MKKFVLLACTAFTIPLSAGADTLAVAIDKAVKFNPSYQSDIRNYEKQLQDRQVSNGALIPKVELEASNARTDSKNHRNNRSSFNETYSKGVVVSQTLYKGGAIWAGRTQTEFKIKQSYASLRSKEQNLILNVVSAYTEVISTRETKRRRDKLLEVAQTNLEIVRERMQTEVANREELLDAQSNLATAVANKFAADGKLELAENEYFTVVGEKAPQNMQSLETLVKANKMTLGTMEQALKDGLKHNPDVQSARYGVDVAKQAMLVKRGNLLPSVSVSYRHTISENSNAGGALNTSNTLSLSTKIPLYQQGVAWSQMDKSRIDQRRALNALDTAKLVNEKNIRKYWFDVESTKKTSNAYQLALKASEEREKIVREEFQEGNKTLTDLNKAVSDVTSAQVSYLTSMRGTILAQYRLQAAVGKLIAENQFAPNVENISKDNMLERYINILK